jgi:hypothetical protein
MNSYKMGQKVLLILGVVLIAIGASELFVKYTVSPRLISSLICGFGIISVVSAWREMRRLRRETLIYRDLLEPIFPGECKFQINLRPTPSPMRVFLFFSQGINLYRGEIGLKIPDAGCEVTTRLKDRRPSLWNPRAPISKYWPRNTYNNFF